MLAGWGKAFGLFQVTQQMLCRRGKKTHKDSEAACQYAHPLPPFLFVFTFIC